MCRWVPIRRAGGPRQDAQQQTQKGWIGGSSSQPRAGAVLCRVNLTPTRLWRRLESHAERRALRRQSHGSRLRGLVMSSRPAGDDPHLSPSIPLLQHRCGSEDPMHALGGSRHPCRGSPRQVAQQQTQKGGIGQAASPAPRRAVPVST